MPSPYILTKTGQRFKYAYVSEKLVWKQLKELKWHKATGIDDLPSNLIIYCSSEIAKPLPFSNNLTLQTGVSKLVSMVPPFHKSGDENNEDNYRTISIPPALSKTKAVKVQSMNTWKRILFYRIRSSVTESITR